MRLAGALLTLSVLSFAAVMNTLVYLRQQELQSLDHYRASLTSFLGPSFLRERWFGIYRRSEDRRERKIGYSGTTYEKVLAVEGIEYHVTLDSTVEIDFMGFTQWVALRGSLVADKELKPTALRLEAELQNHVVEVTGSRKDGQFVAVVKTGAGPPFQITLPLEELHLADALVPTLPIAGFHVGDTFQVACFDPLLLRRSMATARVVRMEEREVAGKDVDAYLIETSFRNLTSRSWMTEAGEVLEQQFGPPLEDVILRRATRESARRLDRR